MRCLGERRGKSTSYQDFGRRVSRRRGRNSLADRVVDPKIDKLPIAFIHQDLGWWNG